MNITFLVIPFLAGLGVSLSGPLSYTFARFPFGFNFTNVSFDSLYQSSICDIFIIRLLSVVPTCVTLLV